MNAKTRSLGALILITTTMLSACGTVQTDDSVSAPNVASVQSDADTSTQNPTSTIPPTSSPAPTVTPTPKLPTLLNTPVPSHTEVISPQNVNRLVEISLWGQGAPHSVVHSPDGQQIVVGTSTGIYLYDSQSFQLVKYINTHNWVDRDRFFSLPVVAISPDNIIIAGVSNDNQITLWDAVSGEELKVLIGHTNRVSQLSFAPDGKTLVSSADDKNIKIWDIASGTELSVITTQANSTVPVFGLSPDGVTIAFETNNGNGEIQVLDIASGKQLYKFIGHTNSTITRIAFAPDGKTFLSAAGDTTIKIWDVNNGNLLKTLRGHTNQVNWFAISPDGKTLASTSLDDTIILWDIASGDKIQSWVGSSWGIEQITFSPDGQTLISTSGLGALSDGLKIWNAASGEELYTINSCFHNDIDFSMDGKLLGTVSCDENIEILDTTISDENISLSAPDARTEQLVFSPDGTIVATGEYDGTVRLWEVVSGEEMLILPKIHNRPIVQIFFLQDGNFLVSQDRYGVVVMWDLADGSEVYKTSVGAPISLSPDGKVFAGGAEISTFPDGTTYNLSFQEVSLPSSIILWDASTGQQIQKLNGHKDYVHITKFSPDGKIIASASNDATVKLWDAISGEEIITLIGHTERVFDVAFSPDGNILASVSRDKSMILWDVGSGKKLFEINDIAGVPYRVVFSPDGSKVVLLLTAGAIQFWGIYP
ncbi:MAG: WD40 repeat domain-containing protein [Anaerolineales bacterium]|nr:MAG: WD40 repeat domain-containing protein [Anaerolineales bacterium]